MKDIVMPIGYDNQEIELLEEWLPMLNPQKRAYIKGATEALLYAQGDRVPPDTEVPYPCLWPYKAPDNAG
jgi:hypothetical protein